MEKMKSSLPFSTGKSIVFIRLCDVSRLKLQNTPQLSLLQITQEIFRTGSAVNSVVKSTGYEVRNAGGAHKVRTVLPAVTRGTF